MGANHVGGMTKDLKTWRYCIKNVTTDLSAKACQTKDEEFIEGRHFVCAIDEVNHEHVRSFSS